MPTFKITDPQSGQTLRVTGDSPPTEAELVEIFAGTAPEKTQQVEQPAQAAPGRRATDRGIGEQVLGGLEAAGTVVSGAIAEPIAGIAGVAKSITSGPEAATETIEQVREGLTFQPRTEVGQESLQTVGEFIAPVGEALQTAQTTLGDFAFKETGSPALAAAAATIPTALLEVAGFKGAKTVSALKNKFKKARNGDAVTGAINEAAPSVSQLKTTSRAVFKEIDDLGVTVKADAFETLVNRIDSMARKGGLDPDITPKANKALQRLSERVGDNVSLTELDTLRKVAQGAAKSLDPADKALGVRMIDEIDSFLDAAGTNVFDAPRNVAGGKATAEIGKRYKVARELWGRARRSELLGEAFEKARLQASGFENGVRTQFRSILNNKKQSRFFNASEKAAMQRVVKGGKAENLFKIIGKLGFTEGSATSFLGGSIGVGAGAAAFGPAGAVAVPFIGQVSKKLAQKLTERGAKFADQVVRAGADARKITSAYLKNTPKAQRNAAELSELLMKTDVDLSLLPDNDFARLAGELAKENRKALTVAAGAGSLGGVEEEIKSNAQ